MNAAVLGQVAVELVDGPGHVVHMGAPSAVVASLAPQPWIVIARRWAGASVVAGAPTAGHGRTAAPAGLRNCWIIAA